MMRFIVAFGLILLAAFSRLIPHPANFTPITAIALFGAAYLDKRSALIIPVLAMLVSDYFLGFHSGMVWVYGSFLAIACLGFVLRNRRTVPMILGASKAGSVLFFIVTNFGVWMKPAGLYPPTQAGLIACYTAAIPFFRNTLGGDLFFVTVMFGLYALVERLFFKTATVPAAVRE
jgi:hypothetical protein